MTDVSRETTRPAREPRCDRSDLLVSQCAHCTGARLDPDLEGVSTRPPADAAALGPAFEAEYRGTCEGCGNPIRPGQTIRAVDGELYSKLTAYVHDNGECIHEL